MELSSIGGVKESDEQERECWLALKFNQVKLQLASSFPCVLIMMIIMKKLPCGLVWCGREFSHFWGPNNFLEETLIFLWDDLDFGVLHGLEI